MLPLLGNLSQYMRRDSLLVSGAASASLNLKTGCTGGVSEQNV